MKKNTLVMIGGFMFAAAIVFLLMAATPGSSGIAQFRRSGNQGSHNFGGRSKLTSKKMLP